MSSTVLGWPAWNPYGHPMSSFVLCVSSYLPSSLFLMKPSSTRLSSSGYTDPGDGLHQPLVITSISSIISAPFLGERSSSVITHILSPRLFLISPNDHIPTSNYQYRISDTG